jgi:molecular chaperone IbpA
MNYTTRRVTSDLLHDPFFIGFDKVLSKLASSTPGQSNNYPPYNIIKTEENHYELQLAIAGFSLEDLEVELKDGLLVVEGKKEDEDKAEYIHKGISARAFRRTFTLADTIVVNSADLKDGILTILLENIVPEEKRPRKIAIGHSKPELLVE